MSLDPEPAPLSRRWRRSPRRTGSTATSSWSTRCGPPTRCAPASSTSPRDRGPGDPPVATLTLQPTSTWQGHRAGQYVQVGVEVDGARRTTRCFSISSASPGRGEPFTLTLRANPDGVGLGATWSTGPVPARCCTSPRRRASSRCPTRCPTSLLFISGGSGITPVMSMVRTLLRAGTAAGSRSCTTPSAADHQIFADGARGSAARNDIDVHLLYPETGERLLLAERARAAGPGPPRRRHLGLRPGRR